MNEETEKLKKQRKQRKPFRTILNNASKKYVGIEAVTSTKHAYLLKIDTQISDFTIVSVLGEIANNLNKEDDLPNYRIDTERKQGVHLFKILFSGHPDYSSIGGDYL